MAKRRNLEEFMDSAPTPPDEEAVRDTWVDENSVTHATEKSKTKNEDSPERSPEKMISNGVKIAGTVTGIAGVIAGSPVAVAVGAAAVAGAYIYNLTKPEGR